MYVTIMVDKNSVLNLIRMTVREKEPEAQFEVEYNEI